MIVRSYRTAATESPGGGGERTAPSAEDARLDALARAYWRLWRRNWRPPLDDAAFAPRAAAEPETPGPAGDRP